MIKLSFKENLKKYREQAGYASAKEFADALELPYQKYMNYENKGSEPKYDVLCKISQLLKVSTDELLGNELIDELTKYLNLCNSLGIEAERSTDEVVYITIPDKFLTIFLVNHIFIIKMRYILNSKKVISQQNKILFNEIYNEFQIIQNKGISSIANYYINEQGFTGLKKVLEGKPMDSRAQDIINDYLYKQRNPQKD